MTTLRGIGTALQVGLTGASVPVASVSKTFPALVVSAAHGLVTGDLAQWSVRRGMHALHGLLTRVQVVDANTFWLPEVDANRWPAWVSGGCSKVYAWESLADTVGYRFGQARGATVDVTKHYHQEQRLGFGGLQNELFEITRLPQTVVPQTLKRVFDYARLHQTLTWRVRSSDGAMRFFAGVPSFANESLSVGSLASGGFSIAVVGQVRFFDAPVVVAVPRLFSLEEAGVVFDLEL